MENKTVDLVPAGQYEVTEAERDFMPVMSVASAVRRREMVEEFARSVMKEGEDFGVIPGGGTKPTLLKPGAEKLCSLFGLEPKIEAEHEEIDWTGEKHGGEMHMYCRMTIGLYRGTRRLGVGIGSANSWESKYRWRKLERKCPVCGKENIRQSKQEPGWYCWKKTGGCGATFKANDPAITTQNVGRIPNPDIADLVNTLHKMAQKRAIIAAVLIATGASAFYTQDMEDAPAPAPEDSPEPPKPAVAPEKNPGSGERQVPPEVYAIWVRMGSSRKAINEEINKLRGELHEVMPSPRAEEVYAELQAENPVGRTLGEAQKLIHELWLSVQLAKTIERDQIEEEPVS